MKTVALEMNGKAVTMEEGKTLLDAAKTLGIDIPTLCHNEKLAPHGGCRMCSVEIFKGKRSRVVTSCVYPVEEGLVVKTDSPRVIKIRKMLIELVMACSPRTKSLEALAERYGVKGTRFKADESFCIMCGLCVRYCAEVKKAHAIAYVGRGVTRRVAFIPEVASRVCMSCRECFTLCPTAKLPRETDGVCFAEMTVDDFVAEQSK